MSETILTLNGDTDYDSWADEGFKFVKEADLGNVDGTKAPEETLKKIAERTKEEKFDAIIIQNNMGIGARKAQAVAQEMRSKVIVVWNDEPTTSSKSPYIELGVKHFTSMSNLRKCLDELIKGGGQK